MIDIKTCETWCKEYKRNYFGNCRVFQHPSYASVVIVFENDKLKGMINKRYTKSAARWRYVTTNQCNYYGFVY